MQARTGIIGGSGLYDIQGIEVIDTLEIETPYGKTSDQLLLASINGKSEEHTSELQSHHELVCRLLLEKKTYRTSK